ncbi:MAG: PIN domain-containing protein [Nitrospirota bacterium]
MIAYVDSSVLLRVVLGQRHALREWPTIERGIASALVQVECLRTLDRLRIQQRIDQATIAERREAIYTVIDTLEIAALTQSVLSRAAAPFPTELGTLDALHLATVLLWRDQVQQDLVMATHDAALGLAARASGLRVVGV